MGTLWLKLLSLNLVFVAKTLSREVNSSCSSEDAPGSDCPYIEEDEPAFGASLLQVGLRVTKGVDRDRSSVLAKLAANTEATRDKSIFHMYKVLDVRSFLSDEHSLPLILSLLAACTIIVTALSCLSSKGITKSGLSLLGRSLEEKIEAVKQGKCMRSTAPPWDVAEASRQARSSLDAPLLQSGKAKKDSRSSSLADSASEDVVKVPTSRVPLPPLNSASSHGLTLESCFTVALEDLHALSQKPIDVLSKDGKKLLQASVRVDSHDERRLLELTLDGESDGPHATVHLGDDNAHMVLFGQDTLHPYANIEMQAGGGSQLYRDGCPAMLLQPGFVSDLRLRALNSDGDTIASGGRYVGVRRRPGEVWKLRSSSTMVDPLVILASMLATILMQQASPQDEVGQPDADALIEVMTAGSEASESDESGDVNI